MPSPSPPPFYVPILVAGMLITGSSLSLWNKWQDMQCVENCNDPDPTLHVFFAQPILQTLQMFLGEMLSLLPIMYSTARAYFFPSAAISLAEHDYVPNLHANTRTKPLRGAKILLLWLPAACDLAGTTLLGVGLLYTPVSIYQMTRAAVVLFVGIMSVVFLRRKLQLYQWLSLVTVVGGVALVGLSGSLVEDVLRDTVPGKLISWLLKQSIVESEEEKSVPLGVFFILLAQIFVAAQFVIEEKIMSRYAVSPLVVVGFEGLFGAVSILLFMPLLFLPRIAALTPLLDIRRGWLQIISDPVIWHAGIAVAVSIPLFNYFGLSMTRHVSATARSLTDTCRTLTIWLVSLGLGWEFFVWPVSLLQVVGFGLLVYGTFVFNGLVRAPPSFLPKLKRAPIPPFSSTHSSGTAAAAAEDEAQRELLDETATLPADLGLGGYDVLPPSSGQDDSHVTDRSD